MLGNNTNKTILKKFISLPKKIFFIKKKKCDDNLSTLRKLKIFNLLSILYSYLLLIIPNPNMSFALISFSSSSFSSLYFNYKKYNLKKNLVVVFINF